MSNAFFCEHKYPASNPTNLLSFPVQQENPRSRMSSVSSVSKILFVFQTLSVAVVVLLDLFYPEKIPWLFGKTKETLLYEIIGGPMPFLIFSLIYGCFEWALRDPLLDDPNKQVVCFIMNGEKDLDDDPEFEEVAPRQEPPVLPAYREAVKEDDRE